MGAISSVLDAARVGAAEPEPGFLDGVVRFVQGAEHAVGHGPQVGALLLGSLRQVVALVHGHILWPHSVIVLTNTTQSR